MRLDRVLVCINTACPCVTGAAKDFVQQAADEEGVLWADRGKRRELKSQGGCLLVRDDRFIEIRLAKAALLGRVDVASKFRSSGVLGSTTR